MIAMISMQMATNAATHVVGGMPAKVAVWVYGIQTLCYLAAAVAIGWHLWTTRDKSKRDKKVQPGSEYDWFLARMEEKRANGSFHFVACPETGRPMKVAGPHE